MLRNHFVLSIAIAMAGVVGCESQTIEDDAGTLPRDGGSEPEVDGGTPVEADGGIDAGATNVEPDAGQIDAGFDAGVAPPEPPRGLRVVGNQIFKDGAPYQIRGVNRSGTEYACVQHGGLFDGPSDDASLDAIASWGANAVRIPLNETCWLGINGVSPAASGAAYQEAILAYVRRVEAHGMTPILDLHWAAPGTIRASEQLQMPNADHSRELWRQVATAVRGDPYVVLELYNEPWPDTNQDSDAAWRCWRDGGSCPGISYEAVGMQDLVDAVRSTGAENVLLAGGIRFASTLSRWLDYMPHDPLGQLGCAWHVYQGMFCDTVACYDGAPAQVAAAVPIVVTELGQDNCGGDFITTLMSWLDDHGAGYLAWTWNTWGRCMVLIDDWAGTPRGVYGTTYRDHLRSRAGR